MNVSEELTAVECNRCNTFLIDGSVSTAEQQQRMKEHLDATHPYWELEDLETGARDYKTNFRLVTRQRRDTRGSIESGEEQDELGRTGIDRKQLFGIIGSILLFFGVFTPIISAPIVGSINYFQNGKGDGVIVLVLALISIGLVLLKKYGGLYLTGAGSLAILVITFLNFQIRISQMQTEMETTLAGNPFRGVADVAMHSIQIQWGWAVLIIGAVFLIAAAAISDKG